MEYLSQLTFNFQTINFISHQFRLPSFVSYPPSIVLRLKILPCRAQLLRKSTWRVHVLRAHQIPPDLNALVEKSQAARRWEVKVPISLLHYGFARIVVCRLHYRWHAFKNSRAGGLMLPNDLSVDLGRISESYLVEFVLVLHDFLLHVVVDPASTLLHAKTAVVLKCQVDFVLKVVKFLDLDVLAKRVSHHAKHVRFPSLPLLFGCNCTSWKYILIKLLNDWLIAVFRILVVVVDNWVKLRRQDSPGFSIAILKSLGAALQQAGVYTVGDLASLHALPLFSAVHHHQLVLVNELI